MSRFAHYCMSFTYMGLVIGATTAALYTQQSISLWGWIALVAFDLMFIVLAGFYWPDEE